MATDGPSVVDTNASDNKGGDGCDDEYFMRRSLEVAQRALEVGEVPVGCVIVLDKDHPVVAYKKKNWRKNEKDADKNLTPEERHGVIISHGANQVNATRDATRHAEVVAIDRLLTDGLSSDQLRLARGANRKSTAASTNKCEQLVLDAERKRWQDRWIDVSSSPGHWTNAFGWRNNFECASSTDEDEEFKSISKQLRSKDIFKHCQLYVTCEVSEAIICQVDAY